MRNEEEYCLIRSKEEFWGHILICGGTRFTRDEILDKRIRNISAEIGVMRIIGCKNEEQWQKIGLYIIEYTENMRGWLQRMK
jgi:hypothetical protein